MHPREVLICIHHKCEYDTRLVLSGVFPYLQHIIHQLGAIPNICRMPDVYVGIITKPARDGYLLSIIHTPNELSWLIVRHRHASDYEYRRTGHHSNGRGGIVRYDTAYWDEWLSLESETGYTHVKRALRVA